VPQLEMQADFQKPSGLAYVTTKDIGRNRSIGGRPSDASQNSTPQYWSADRIRSYEQDITDSLFLFLEVALFSGAAPEVATAVAALAAVPIRWRTARRRPQ
jgi:hypothetical protein